MSLRVPASRRELLQRVSGRTDTTDATAAVGVFGRLGSLVVRWPLLVIGCWIALAAVVSLAFPPLTTVASHDAGILPDNAPVMVTAREMADAFHDPNSDNVLLVVLTHENGLGPADENIYRAVIDKLRQDTRDVVMVQDFVTTPPLREVVTSKDNSAWYVPITLAAEPASPESYAAYQRIATTVKETVAGSSLTAHLAGPAATFADLTDIGQRDLRLVEGATAIMVLLILLIVYRNPVTMLLPLITIGVSLVTAQGILSGLAQVGMAVSDQTIVLMTGIMAGAGTDYAVFLISRYHDYVRLGADSNQAVKRALASIGKVIAASAATVAVTFLGMVFARMSVFSTVGPAMAIAIGVAFVAAVTLLPAILVLAGPRGWVRPRRDLTTRFWRRSGIRIVRRPTIHLVASLIVLLALAGAASLVRYNYDDRKTLPASVESAVGYAAMDRHFPLNSTLPQYLFISSPHDLRTPRALADMEQMAYRISQLPDIAMVRGITRPTGESLEQTKATYQSGEVGSKLGDASKQITDHTGDLDQLSHGAGALADGLADVRGQVGQAVATVRGLVEALTYMSNQFGANKTLNDIDNAAKLVTGMRALGDTIGVNISNVAGAFDWAGPVLNALGASPICDADISCSTTRSQLQRLVTARSDGTLDKLSDLARQLQSTQNGQTLDVTVKKLRGSLDAALGALRSMGLDSPGSMQAKLANLQQGADTLADASRKLADGVALLVDQTKQLGGGLGDASAFLLAMKYDATSPSMAGFYIPPQMLDADEFRKAADVFISPDGHSARYLIQTTLNPFGTEAMDQVNTITDVARGAQPNTSLADASVSMSGISAGLRDMRDYYGHDVRFVVAATIIIVMLILIALLRSIVAPLYLIASVVISYLSALGIGVLAFQVILGQELSWSVPGLAFIVLVAVGADYNMLLISRIRDESPHGIRSGVIRTVGTTGGVITSAGLIFAASMFGLLFASISTMVQAGFIIGIGILLDTFLVRTITVPAMAVLVGRANWWPSGLWQGRHGRHQRRRRVVRRSKHLSHDPALPSESIGVGVR